ncbi:MAG TPA: hypothetical protein PLQ36_00705 [Candidatus Gracilibacteria bacterium]|nr:hypothetical protein [Candidatus Gracilibacteria bacterium]
MKIQQKLQQIRELSEDYVFLREKTKIIERIYQSKLKQKNHEAELQDQAQAELLILDHDGCDGKIGVKTK